MEKPTGKIYVSVVTPAKEVLHEHFDEVYIPGALGEVGILPQHTPLFTLLGIGKLTLISGNARHYFVISGGFAEVSRDRILILTEFCEKAEDINAKRAKADLEESEKALLHLTEVFGPEYKAHSERVRRAQSRVEVADLVS